MKKMPIIRWNSVKQLKFRRTWSVKQFDAGRITSRREIAQVFKLLAGKLN